MKNYFSAKFFQGIILSHCAKLSAIFLKGQRYAKSPDDDGKQTLFGKQRSIYLPTQVTTEKKCEAILFLSLKTNLYTLKDKYDDVNLNAHCCQVKIPNLCTNKPTNHKPRSKMWCLSKLGNDDAKIGNDADPFGSTVHECTNPKNKEQQMPHLDY